MITIIEVTWPDYSKIEPDQLPCVNEVLDDAIAKMMVLQFVPEYKQQLKQLERNENEYA